MTKRQGKADRKLDLVGGQPAPRPMRLPSGEAVVVRRLTRGDSLEELTTVLHRAYFDHAAAGRVFFASYQTVQDTAHRLARGECWVAVAGSQLVGTVTVSATYEVPEGYPAPLGAGSFWQLAVAPSQRGTGLGQRMLAVAESRVADLGSSQVVIDTSSSATDLLRWYRRRGYIPVGTWRWDVTNYESVVLLKKLAAV
ncbi:ribosomal protein S18 acetylase RimI-like enzyme [Streptacidiphilus sp. BW17]|uniref:GNAT family N-acetyltransferase n=1 Tax=Streptacidiphilus sp. BW17 TaxID=3156274 RepID=UPI003515ABC8